MIVLDASVLIAHVESADRHHEDARNLLLSLGDERLAASVITLAEFYVGPARAGVLDRAEQIIDDLGVVTIELPVDAPRRLAELRARTKLKLPDCCVLLAAEQATAAIASFDDAVVAQAAAVGLEALGRNGQ